MFHSLKAKFIIAFFLLELLFFVLVIGINFNSLDKASQTLTDEKISATNQLLVKLLETPLIIFDLATIDDIVKNFSTLKNAAALQIEDANHNKLSTYLKRDSISRERFEEALLKKSTNLEDKAQIYALHSTDIKAEGEIIGHIHFMFNTTESFEHIKKNKQRSYIMVIAALLVSLLIAYVIGGRLSKSLMFLTKIAQDVSEDKKVNIPYKANSKDEMGILFYSMHLMQEIISQRTEKLNQSIQIFGKNVIASSSDLKGKVTYASQALCDISQYTQEELLGQDHNILRHEDTPRKLFEGLWKSISEGKVWQGEIKNRKKDGGYYWVYASIEPEYDQNHKIIGYTSIRQDITAKKAKEEFMANMSHELRTPLNAIIGLSGILNRKIKNGEQLSLLKHIRSSSHSLLTLINNILDLSKIEDSKFAIEPYLFNAYDEILDYSENFQGLTSERNITIHQKIHENLKVTLWGDWHRISQVILNIISNSIKFTPLGGTILYEASYEDGILLLTVTDNGIGMSQEVQNKIFQPFVQADGSTTRKYGGTGLGLSITHSLIELMHGNIALNSQEGSGTTFTVTIPLEEKIDISKEDEKLSETGKSPKELLSGHILVAEDNKTNQLLITILLKEFGLSCDIAHDGLEAVKMYDPRQHSLILMDENMPNMSGLEAMRALKEKYKDSCGPIVALTANTMEGDEKRFLELGMDGYVAKPIDEHALHASLKALLKN